MTRPLSSPCQRHGLAVPREGDRSYVTGSIRGWSRSHLTYIPGGCSLEERNLTWQSPSITVEFSVQYNLKTTPVIIIIIIIKFQPAKPVGKYAPDDKLQRYP